MTLKIYLIFFIYEGLIELFFIFIDEMLFSPKTGIKSSVDLLLGFD